MLRLVLIRKGLSGRFWRPVSRYNRGLVLWRRWDISGPGFVFSFVSMLFWSSRCRPRVLGLIWVLVRGRARVNKCCLWEWDGFLTLVEGNLEGSSTVTKGWPEASSTRLEGSVPRRGGKAGPYSTSIDLTEWGVGRGLGRGCVQMSSVRWARLWGRSRDLIHFHLWRRFLDRLLKVFPKRLHRLEHISLKNTYFLLQLDV